MHVGGGRENGTEITVSAPERHCLQLRALWLVLQGFVRG